jgi:hypothetical protein
MSPTRTRFGLDSRNVISDCSGQFETRVLREVGRVGADSSGLAERHIR